jgi:hypothetical protein
MGIEPMADRNIERITTCCLDAPPKMSFLFGKGRGGGGWWFIWIWMATFVPAISLPIFAEDTLAVYRASMILTVAMGVFVGLNLTFWSVRVWKNHYPIRFCRKTRKVYCYWENKTLVEDWDTLKVYLQVNTEFTPQGAPSQVPLINIEFHREDGSIYTTTLVALSSILNGLSPAEEAAAAWEYIRRYMEEGPEQLQEPDIGVEKALAFDELLQAHNPFPIIRNDNKLMWPLHIALFFPTRCIWFLITYPTELLYYLLDKKVDMKPYPPEMDEPCRCEDEVVIWHPKMRLEQRKHDPAERTKKRIPIIR